MKRCSKCAIAQPLENFSRDKNRKDGYYHRCKNCSKEDQDKYRNKSYPKSSRRYIKYGLTEEAIREMLKNQGYICPLCRTRLDEDYVVDHCHSSNLVRGILHRICNTRLGVYEKSILPNLSDYNNYLKSVGNT